MTSVKAYVSILENLQRVAFYAKAVRRCLVSYMPKSQCVQTVLLSILNIDY